MFPFDTNNNNNNEQPFRSSERDDISAKESCDQQQLKRRCNAIDSVSTFTSNSNKRSHLEDISSTSRCTWNDEAEHCNENPIWKRELIEELDCFGTSQYWTKILVRESRSRTILFPQVFPVEVFKELTYSTQPNLLQNQYANDIELIQQALLPTIQKTTVHGILYDLCIWGKQNQDQQQNPTKSKWLLDLEDNQSILWKADIATQLAVIYFAAKTIQNGHELLNVSNELATTIYPQLFLPLPFILKLKLIQYLETHLNELVSKSKELTIVSENSKSSKNKRDYLIIKTSGGNDDNKSSKSSTGFLSIFSALVLITMFTFNGASTVSADNTLSKDLSSHTFNTANEVLNSIEKTDFKHEDESIDILNRALSFIDIYNAVDDYGKVEIGSIKAWTEQTLSKQKKETEQILPMVRIAMLLNASIAIMENNDLQLQRVSEVIESCININQTEINIRDNNMIENKSNQTDLDNITITSSQLSNTKNIDDLFVSVSKINKANFRFACLPQGMNYIQFYDQSDERLRINTKLFIKDALKKMKELDLDDAVVGSLFRSAATLLFHTDPVIMLLRVIKTRNKDLYKFIKARRSDLINIQNDLKNNPKNAKKIKMLDEIVAVWKQQEKDETQIDVDTFEKLIQNRQNEIIKILYNTADVTFNEKFRQLKQFENGGIIDDTSDPIDAGLFLGKMAELPETIFYTMLDRRVYKSNDGDYDPVKTNVHALHLLWKYKLKTIPYLKIDGNSTIVGDVINTATVLSNQNILAETEIYLRKGLAFLGVETNRIEQHINEFYKNRNTEWVQLSKDVEREAKSEFRLSHEKFMGLKDLATNNLTVDGVAWGIGMWSLFHAQIGTVISTVATGGPLFLQFIATHAWYIGAALLTGTGVILVTAFNIVKALIITYQKKSELKNNKKVLNDFMPELQQAQISHQVALNGMVQTISAAENTQQIISTSNGTNLIQETYKIGVVLNNGGEFWVVLKYDEDNNIFFLYPLTPKDHRIKRARGTKAMKIPLAHIELYIWTREVKNIDNSELVDLLNTADK